MGEFGKRLRELRIMREITQEQLAEKADISRVMIGRYETTDQLPALDTLVRIADALGVSTDYLLGRSTVRTSFAEEEPSTALRRMTETGAQALLALRKMLGDAPEEQSELAERLLQLSAYQMLMPLEGRERPGDADALCAAAIRLTQEKLRAGSGEGASLTVPEELRAKAEEQLARLRQLWSE